MPNAFICAHEHTHASVYISVYIFLYVYINTLTQTHTRIVYMCTLVVCLYMYIISLPCIVIAEFALSNITATKQNISDFRFNK